MSSRANPADAVHPTCAHTTSHWRVEARTTDEAEAALQRFAPHTRLEVGGPATHRLVFHSEDRFTIGTLEFDGPLSGVNEPDDTVTVQVALSGRTEWMVGDDHGAGVQPWLQGVDTPTFARFGPVTEIAAIIGKTDLREFARAFYGDDELTLAFDGALPGTGAYGQHAKFVLTSTALTAATPAFEEPLVRTALHRQLCVMILEGFRLRGDRRYRTLTAEGRRRRYWQASRFIDEYASLSITVEDAARAAGVSTGELEQIFRAHSPSGRTFTQQLHRTRLHAAHQDLLRSDPAAGVTVAGIAARWGYTDPRRFIRQYLRIYGLAPQHTLERRG